MKSVVVFLLCLATICWARVADKPEDPLVIAYNSLPESEKKDFLRYNLALAVIEEESEENQRPRIKSIKLSKNQKNEEFVIPDSLNITENLVDKFSDMDIPERSTLLLLSWIEEEFNLNEEEVKELVLKGSVCPSRLRSQCFDFGGVGPSCCPW